MKDIDKTKKDLCTYIALLETDGKISATEAEALSNGVLTMWMLYEEQAHNMHGLLTESKTK